MVGHTGRPPGPDKAFEALRRRISLAALSLGAVALFARWLIELLAPRPSVFDRIALPVVAGGLSLCGLVYARGGRGRPAAMGVAYALLVLFLIAELARSLFVLPEGREAAFALGKAFAWIPLVLIIVWLIRYPGHGTSLAAGSYGLFLIPGVAFIVLAALGRRGGAGVADTIDLIVQAYAASGVMLVLVSALTRLAERYIQSRVLAEAMERLAMTDPLTDLPNRRYLSNELAREIGRAQRYSRPLALVLFDVDHFKAINDAGGHDAGDQALVEVARRARGSLREADVLGRWGGEEFLLVAPEADLDQAAALAERIRTHLADTPVDGVGRVTASFGVVALRDGDVPERLVERADAALYRAKEGGRNRVAVG